LVAQKLQKLTKICLVFILYLLLLALVETFIISNYIVNVTVYIFLCLCAIGLLFGVFTGSSFVIILLHLSVHTHIYELRNM